MWQVYENRVPRDLFRTDEDELKGKPEASRRISYWTSATNFFFLDMRKLGLVETNAFRFSVGHPLGKRSI